MKDVDALLQLLHLEQVEWNLFRGSSHEVGSSRVFGGQVLSQALNAAMQTVPEDRVAHSMHAYFLLAGDLEIPIVFDVDRIRDGGSFTTRRIRAIQKGQVILNMSASFQSRQEGFDHQIEMPVVTPPEELANWEDIGKKFGEFMQANQRRFFDIDRPIEFKPVELHNPWMPEKQEPLRHVWMRAKGQMPDDLRAHQLVLAYASDYNLLTTALLPHGEKGAFDKLQMASLDHAMWFHRDFRIDDWLLYQVDSPSASNARGFTRGNVFTREGKLVASVVQEGLIRPKREK